MMMNCFCGMVDRRKAFSLISSRDHCQRSSPLRISDMPSRVWTCAEPEFRLSWMKLCSSHNHYIYVGIYIYIYTYIYYIYVLMDIYAYIIYIQYIYVYNVYSVYIYIYVYIHYIHYIYIYPYISSNHCGHKNIELIKKQQNFSWETFLVFWAVFWYYI